MTLTIANGYLLFKVPVSIGCTLFQSIHLIKYESNTISFKRG
nr:MAG TPA: hypothetical protein [Caudoviricetes sp.]